MEPHWCSSPAASVSPRPARTRAPGSAGGARFGGGAGLRARPACAASAALRAQAVQLRRPGRAEPSHQARMTGAGMERRAVRGRFGVGWGLSVRRRSATRGCVAAPPASGGRHL